MKTRRLIQFTVTVLCFATFVRTANAVDLKPGKCTGTMEVILKNEDDGYSVKKRVPIVARVAGSSIAAQTAKILVQPGTVDILTGDYTANYYFYHAGAGTLYKANDDTPYFGVGSRNTATSLTIFREQGPVEVGNTVSGNAFISP
jgi:hypothetical protein